VVAQAEVGDHKEVVDQTAVGECEVGGVVEGVRAYSPVQHRESEQRPLLTLQPLLEADESQDLQTEDFQPAQGGGFGGGLQVDFARLGLLAELSQKQIADFLLKWVLFALLEVENGCFLV